jgi:hypothetical protein
MTSRASEAVAKGSLPPEPDARSQGVQARARESIPTALPLARVTPVPDDPYTRARDFLTRVFGAFVIPRGTNLLQVDHGSLHSAHLRHVEAAGECKSPAARALRRAWGWLHLVVKACLDVAEWLAESPARAVAAVVVYLLVTHWL